MQYNNAVYYCLAKCVFSSLFVICLIAAATSTSLSDTSLSKKGPALDLRQQLQGGTLCWAPTSECNPSVHTLVTQGPNKVRILALP